MIPSHPFLMNFFLTEPLANAQFKRKMCRARWKATILGQASIADDHVPDQHVQDAVNERRADEERPGPPLLIPDSRSPWRGRMPRPESSCPAIAGNPFSCIAPWCRTPDIWARPDRLKAATAEGSKPGIATRTAGSRASYLDYHMPDIRKLISRELLKKASCSSRRIRSCDLAIDIGSASGVFSTENQLGFTRCNRSSPATADSSALPRSRR